MTQPPAQIFEELDPEPRLLMGPGPVDLYPRVQRAMATPLQGQFDPQFTNYMNQTMALYRQVFQTRNHWTFLVNGTARAGIEACLMSLLAPGDRVLAPIFGRFGHLLTEIASRADAEVHNLETEWGTVFEPQVIEDAVKKIKPAVLAISHGDTSTTMAQPLQEIGEICRRHGTLLYVDATATVGGNPMPVDDWGLDIVSAGLQKCLSGPPGSSPVTFSDEVAERLLHRKHTEAGIRVDDSREGDGPVIRSNYFDLPMLMDYWSPSRLNHHTESASMLYAARECARVVLGEGLAQGIERHRLSSRALRAGLDAMNLELFGDPDHRMLNVTGIFIPAECGDGAAVRQQMLLDFGIEIGTSFGPLDGKIWRIGTMGHVCRKANVLRCLSSLEAVLTRNGVKVPQAAGVSAAYAVYTENDDA
ncbi:MAG: alanine--glyoxylate aminotransferase family protein [Gammaproteobacteria bacterium]|nr:alanine--glyoxylate aminotransferase family protein [Gammaproteobacteria bacterium]